MNVTEVFERRSERGSPRGSESVWSDATAQTDGHEDLRLERLPTNRSNRGWPIVGAAAACVAVIVTLIGLGVARDGDDRETVTAEQPQGAVPSTVLDRVRPEDAPGTGVDASGTRTAVGGPTFDDEGWIAIAHADPIEGEIPDPILITNDAGEQIAWWGFALGWISFEQMDDPHFDYRQEYAETFQQPPRP